jgi:hypothetical protein
VGTTMPEGWVWDQISDYRLDKKIIVDFLKQIFEGQDDDDFGVHVSSSNEQKHSSTDQIIAITRPVQVPGSKTFARSSLPR